MNERACPVCDVELITDEVFDGSIDIDEREEEWFGYCPECGRHYHWIEVYTYKETKNFEVYVGEDA